MVKLTRLEENSVSEKLEWNEVLPAVELLDYIDSADWRDLIIEMLNFTDEDEEDQLDYELREIVRMVEKAPEGRVGIESLELAKLAITPLIKTKLELDKDSCYVVGRAFLQVASEIITERIIDCYITNKVKFPISVIKRKGGMVNSIS